MADVLELLRSALSDRYEVEKLLGEGGMATVFLAKDLRHGRQVAIKTLRAELAASIGADRFLREIQLAANLQHPNILTLYDSGDAQGVLYYVMPFIEGESLRGRLEREQQLPLYDAVRITREAAEGLAFAHEHGVVHRDIKPENILLQNGHALVADFGIARAMDAAGEKLTQTGMAVGTPHYMSPEQALGSDHADARSDVYSLGCVLYELLAGQPPFDGPNSRAIMARHSMEQVPSLQIVRQSVPDELEDAVFTSLEKTPADRFQTMQEFVDTLADLEPTLATRRTSSRGMQAVRRTSRTTRGNVPAVEPPPEATEPAAAAATATAQTPLIRTSRITPFAMAKGIRFWSTAGLVLLAAVGIGVWRLKGHSAGGTKAAEDASLDKNRIAVMYFENRGLADSLSYLGDGLTEALIHELSGVKGLQVISRNGVAPFRHTTVTTDSIGRALKSGTLVQGTVAQSGDRLRVSVSLVNAANGEEIASQTVERPKTEVFALQDDVAKEVALFLRQRLGQEIELDQVRVGTSNTKAWELLQRAGGLSKDLETLLASGDTAAAARHLAQADTLLTQAQNLDPNWAAAPIERGWLAYHQTDLIATFDKTYYSTWTERGLEQANKALQLKPNDPDGLELRGTLEYLRWLLNLDPDPATSKKLVTSAEADLRAAVTAKPTAAWAWTVLSHLLIGQGNTAEAKLAALRSYEADPYLSSAKQTLYRLYTTSYDSEDQVEAAHWCEEGYRRFPDYYRFTECRLSMMGMKGQKPDIAKAWKLLGEFVQTTPPNLRPYHTLYGQMLVGMALVRAGLPDSARAVALRSRGNPEVDPTHDLAYYEAVLRTQLGDKDEALKQLGIYLASNPQQRAGIGKGDTWDLRELR
ncbi:MAG TPA: serine/threonine-protein kinase, partial [Gemmatimonadales bacterium]|nr:serine/threonine-protein kinase [Gemmatimonadales bacterium]